MSTLLDLYVVDSKVVYAAPNAEGIANLSLDGAPIIYVSCSVDGMICLLGRTKNIQFVKVENVSGNPLHTTDPIEFYVYYVKKQK